MRVLENLLLIVLGLSLTPWVQARSRHRQMTLEVAAGYEECFFVDNVKTGQAIDFEFQVRNYFSTGDKIWPNMTS